MSHRHEPTHIINHGKWEAAIVSNTAASNSQWRMQGIYWLLTIPEDAYTRTDALPKQVAWIRGQLEVGENTSYRHWQLMVGMRRKCRLAAIKKLFGERCHAELSRSAAADNYVCKDETSVAGTRFELGEKPIKRNDSKDWDKIRELARRGQLEDIPGDIYVRCYNQLRRIATDHLQPVAIERTVVCYWGKTGTGKSRRAWNEAGGSAYPKDPRSKFWDGYRGQENVVMDEFRGGIDVAHLLRWFDRYPVNVEVKGSSVSLSAKRIWITSNLDPRKWYSELDEDTLGALLRRLNITHFN